MKVAIFAGKGGSFAKYIKESQILNSKIIIIASYLETINKSNVDLFLKKEKNKELEYWTKFEEIVKNNDLIFSQFDYIIPQEICKKYYGKIINHHPALLPAHKGKNAILNTFKSGSLYGGSTVHFVTSEVDNGPIIFQSIYAISPKDTVETLSKKNYYASRDGLVQVVKWFEEKRVFLDKKNGKVLVLNANYNNGFNIPNLEILNE